jgi:glycosyltransferase involved in cell wall biosynthesis
MATISVITPTFRREDVLRRCVESVLAQEVDAEIEHFVVNDYGQPLTHAPWMDDPRVTVLNTYRTERSVARNTGAALSRGDWLYFLDDDDYALPGAFAAMLEVAQRTQAAHIYGGYRIISGETNQETVHQPVLEGDIFPMLLAGEGIPPQATWVRRDAFFQIGAFDLLAVPAEDADLVRRLSLFGPIAGTKEIVANVRVDHAGTTTTNYQKHHGIWLRGTENVLSMPETFDRTLNRTKTEPYWRGRCARVYFGSAGRNLRQRRYGLAWGRLLAALRLCRTAKGENSEFRRGFRRKPGQPLRPQPLSL